MSRTCAISPATTWAWCARRSGVVAEAGADQRLPQVGLAGAAQPDAVAPGARRPRVAVHSSPVLDVAHHPGDHHAVHLGGQRHRALRQPVEVVDGAVDRVDDPAHPARRDRAGSRPPYSSPSTASSGRSCRSASSTCRSTARSAAVTTSVTVLLVAATETPSTRIRYAVAAAPRATSPRPPAVPRCCADVHRTVPFPAAGVFRATRGTILTKVHDLRRIGGHRRRVSVRRRMIAGRRRYNSPLPTRHGPPTTGRSGTRGSLNHIARHGAPRCAGRPGRARSSPPEGHS